MKRKIVAVATALSMSVLGGCSKDRDKSHKDNDTYRPEINDNPNVYGPPPEDREKENKTELKKDFNPEENENEVVYGPPDDM